MWLLENVESLMWLTFYFYWAVPLLEITELFLSRENREKSMSKDKQLRIRGF